MTERYFCSQSSRDRSESVFGTAPRADSWLLIEHPAPWSARGFPDDRLPDAVRLRLKTAAAALPHAKRLMIRRDHRLGENVRLVFVRSSERNPFAHMLTLKAHEDFLSLSPEALADSATPYDRSMFLVCTHGKHDKCCAKFGCSVHRAVRDAAPEDTWECSHVGGDRFAANLVCMPHGIYYGHVSPEAAPAIVAAHRGHKVDLKYYRGRCCYNRATQIGEYFIRRETGLDGIDDLAFRETLLIAENRWSVQFAGPSPGSLYQAEFHRYDTPQKYLLTCQAEHPGSVSRYNLLRCSRLA